MPSIASRCKWVFGTDPDKAAGPGTPGKANNVVGSTGTGATFNTFGYGLQYSFAIESNDSGWAYQIRAGRTSSGPWTVMSSNSGTSTSLSDLVQLQGPLMWVSPRVDAMASTANYVVIYMTGIE